MDGDAAAVQDALASLIHAEVAAFVAALAPHQDRQARLGGSTDLGGEIAFQEGHSAQSEPFDVDPFVTPFLKEGEDIRVHPREEFEDRDPVGVTGLETEGGGGRRLHWPQLQAEGVHLPDIGVVDALKGIEADGADLGGPAAQDDLPVKRHEDPAPRTLSHLQGAAEVIRGIGHGHTQRQLAPGEHHGDGDILQHKGEHGGGIGHGIGSVDEDHAVIAVDIPADAQGQTAPVIRGDVGAVQGAVIFGVDVQRRVIAP